VTVGEITDSPRSCLSNSAINQEKPFRSPVLAEPFPGTVAQGGILVLAKEFSGLINPLGNESIGGVQQTRQRGAPACGRKRA